MLGALTPKPLHTYVTPVLVGCWVVLVMELGAFDRIDRIDHIIPRQGSDHLGRCFLLLLPRFIQWLTDYFSLFSMFQCSTCQVRETCVDDGGDVGGASLLINSLVTGSFGMV